MKLLLLSSVTAAALAYPAFMQSAKAADKTISVKLSNYVGANQAWMSISQAAMKFPAQELRIQSDMGSYPF